MNIHGFPLSPAADALAFDDAKSRGTFVSGDVIGALRRCIGDDVDKALPRLNANRYGHRIGANDIIYRGADRLLTSWKRRRLIAYDRSIGQWRVLQTAH